MTEQQTAEAVTSLAFLDTETTGLHPHLGAEVWECAIIRAEHRPGRLVVLDEWEAQREPSDLSKADPYALKVGDFWSRRKPGWVAQRDHFGRVVATDPDACLPEREFAAEGERRTRGRMMVGAVPSFDADFLGRLLRSQKLPAGWHYQLVDVETLVAGYLAGGPPEQVMVDRPVGHGFAGTGKGAYMAPHAVAQPPWNSDELLGMVGVTIPDVERHTALGDARWAMRAYAAVYGLTIEHEVEP